MTERIKKTVVSWSSGKDSAYALYVAIKSGEYEVTGLLSTVTEGYDRVSMHGVRETLLERQAEELDLPLIKMRIPQNCSNDIYESRMANVVERLVADGITHIIFGDLFLEDIRAYREEKLSGSGLIPVFPIWGRETKKLAEEIIDSGISAYSVCVDPKALSKKFAGRLFDRSFLRDLPPSVDPCGERGEFHTFVNAHPLYRNAKIEVDIGEILERDGFVFADVIPRR